MRERDRIERRTFIEAEQERERRETEQRLRPIREAEAQLNETARKLHDTIRQRLLTMRDDEFRIDPATTEPIL